MIIEYDVVCFERTLKITFPKKYEGREELKSEILKMLDDYYDEWQNSDECMCLEEYMVERLSETYAMWEEWESIPYGDDYEPRETLWFVSTILWLLRAEGVIRRD